MPEEQTTIRSDIMRMAYNVARFHHEKLDGSGYPDKLKGNAIPHEALITSVADMIDAMLDPTVLTEISQYLKIKYKNSFPGTEALNYPEKDYRCSIYIVGQNYDCPKHFSK